VLMSERKTSFNVPAGEPLWVRGVYVAFGWIMWWIRLGKALWRVRR
jgi:hypothetical protein